MNNPIYYRHRLAWLQESDKCIPENYAQKKNSCRNYPYRMLSQAHKENTRIILINLWFTTGFFFFPYRYMTRLQGSLFSGLEHPKWPLLHQAWQTLSASHGCSGAAHLPRGTGMVFGPDNLG